jgi:superfamily I DNA/RNA helicase
MTVQVVTGVAGSGKTHYAMQMIEARLRGGLKWFNIGYASFSRAACLEAAQRASAITGVPEEKLQKEGYFRTIHSSALRGLGVDSKVIIDPESAAGKKWFDEVFGVPRGGDAGTLAAKVDAALCAWDKERATLRGFSKVLNLDIPPSEEGDGREKREKPNVSEFYSKICHYSKVVTADVPPYETLDFREKNASNIVYGDFRNSFQLFTRESRREKKWPSGDIKCEFDSQTPYRERSYESVTQKNSSVIGDGGLGKMTDTPTSENAENIENTGKTETTHSGAGSQITQTPVTTFQVGDGTIGKMDKVSNFDQETEAIIRKYEDQKRIWGKLDFTDILMKFAGIQADSDLRFVQAYPEGTVPHEIKLWIFDEYQDCSVLLDAAAARLAEAAEEVVMLGDTYQAVYGFSGSDWRVMRSYENKAKAEGRRVLLNRSWRNPESVLEWGEKALREDRSYEERRPTTQRGQGSVGMMEMSGFLERMQELAEVDTMILGRTWFALDRVKARLDQSGIPWKSCQEKQKSRWEAPVKIAFTICMRQMRAGEKISEQDWRRITEELPQKWDGNELFERGIKAKWKKMECSRAETHAMGDVREWGATAYFERFVIDEIWRKDSVLLIDMAIEKFGVDLVRNPKIRIGSVHSVKGAEARNVFCLASSSERASGVNTDFWEDLFLKYVAITRASWNYRVVVDLVEHARGKPLFLACPRGYWKFDKELPSELAGVDDTSGISGLDQKAAGSLGSEVSGRNLRNDRDTGRHALREGEVRGDRDEVAGRPAPSDAGIPATEDPAEWWDL